MPVAADDRCRFCRRARYRPVLWAGFDAHCCDRTSGRFFPPFPSFSPAALCNRPLSSRQTRPWEEKKIRTKSQRPTTHTTQSPIPNPPLPPAPPLLLSSPRLLHLPAHLPYRACRVSHPTRSRHTTSRRTDSSPAAGRPLASAKRSEAGIRKRRTANATWIIQWTAGGEHDLKCFPLLLPSNSKITATRGAAPQHS